MYFIVDYSSTLRDGSSLIQMLVVVYLCGYFSFCMWSIDVCFTCVLCLQMVRLSTFSVN